MPSRIVRFIIIVQMLMFLSHWFLYETWTYFFEISRTGGSHGSLALKTAMAVLSVSFVTASLLAFRYFNIFVRVLYTIAAVWLGMLNYFFFAACAAWIVAGVSVLSGLHWQPRDMAVAIFGSALLIGFCGIINASWTRVTRMTIRLPNLPRAWRGRVAAVVSDTHLGHVRNYSFIKRITRMLATTATGYRFFGRRCV